MKKILLKSKRLFGTLLMMQTILTSIAYCQKSDTNADKGTGVPNESAIVKTSKKATITTEPYNAIIFDSCRKENIILSGLATYKLTESFDNGYYLNYEIRLEKVTGEGEVTSTVYHGGGKIVGTVKLNEPGTKERAKVSYRVKYVGDNGYQIFFTQNARFIMVNNEVKVEFNNIFDSCK